MLIFLASNLWNTNSREILHLVHDSRVEHWFHPMKTLQEIQNENRSRACEKKKGIECNLTAKKWFRICSTSFDVLPAVTSRWFDWLLLANTPTLPYTEIPPTWNFGLRPFSFSGKEIFINAKKDCTNVHSMDTVNLRISWKKGALVHIPDLMITKAV